MATHSHAHGRGLAAPQLDALFAPHDPLRDPASWIHARGGAALSFPHLARQLIRMDKAPRAHALSRVVSGAATRLLILAELYAGDPDRARQAARAALEADPDDMQARYLLFRQQLPGRRGRGVPASDGDALAGLEGPALAVARGWQLVREQDWPALAELDGALDGSLVTDVWYPDAALLRARWRIGVGRDRERLASEALRLVDAAWLLSRDLRLPLERMRIGAVLGNDDVLVESARHVVTVFLAAVEQAEANAAPLDPSRRALLTQDLDAVVRALDREFPPGTRRRAGAVLAAARDILRRLDISRGP